jgi:prepilin-type processing-associated H-X9-DG protein
MVRCVSLVLLGIVCQSHARLDWIPDTILPAIFGRYQILYADGHIELLPREELLDAQFNAI